MQLSPLVFCPSAQLFLERGFPEHHASEGCHAAMCLELLVEGSQLQLTCAVSLSRFAWTSLKNKTKSYQFLTPEVPQIQEQLPEGTG